MFNKYYSFIWSILINILTIFIVSKILNSFFLLKFEIFLNTKFKIFRVKSIFFKNHIKTFRKFECYIIFILKTRFSFLNNDDSQINLKTFKLILLILNNFIKIVYQIYSFLKIIDRIYLKILKRLNYFIKYVIENYLSFIFYSLPKFFIFKHIKILFVEFSIFFYI